MKIQCTIDTYEPSGFIGGSPEMILRNDKNNLVRICVGGNEYLIKAEELIGALLTVNWSKP